MLQARRLIEQIVEWTKLKCRIQLASERTLYFKEREVWWASIGANIGSEQNGKHAQFERPVLIFKRFNEQLFYAIPATSKQYFGPQYFFSPSGAQPQTFILSQMRAMSPRRLVRKQRILPNGEFDRLRGRFKNLI